MTFHDALIASHHLPIHTQYATPNKSCVTPQAALKHSPLLVDALHRNSPQLLAKASPASAAARACSPLSLARSPLALGSPGGPRPVLERVEQLQQQMQTMQAVLEHARERLEQAAEGEGAAEQQRATAESEISPVRDCDLVRRQDEARESSLVNPLYIPCSLSGDGGDGAPLAPKPSGAEEPLPQPLRPRQETDGGCADEAVPHLTAAADGPSPEAQHQRRSPQPVASAPHAASRGVASTPPRVVLRSPDHAWLAAQKRGGAEAAKAAISTASRRGAPKATKSGAASSGTASPCAEDLPLRTLASPKPTSGSRYTATLARRYPPATAPIRSAAGSSGGGGIVSSGGGSSGGAKAITATVPTGPLVDSAIASLSASVLRSTSAPRTSDGTKIPSFSTLNVSEGGSVENPPSLTPSTLPPAGEIEPFTDVPIVVGPASVPSRDVLLGMRWSTLAAAAGGMPPPTSTPPAPAKAAASAPNVAESTASLPLPLLDDSDRADEDRGEVDQVLLSLPALPPRWESGARPFVVSSDGIELAHDGAEEEAYRVDSRQLGCRFMPRFIGRSKSSRSMSGGGHAPSAAAPDPIGASVEEARFSSAVEKSVVSVVSAAGSEISELKVKRSLSQNIKRKISKLLGSSDLDNSGRM